MATTGEFIKVTKTGCHEWRGSRFLSGYGRLKFRQKSHRVHRMVYEIVHGPIPPEMCVMHRCDNPICCNPAHLKLGTGPENMADMAAKGRAIVGPREYTHGEEHHAAKLTDAQVQALREEYERGGTNQTALAKKYKVSQTLVSQIARGLHRG